MTIFKQIGILLFTLIFGSSVVYASGANETISWAKLIISLLGGLTLFLFGMEMMSDGMKKTAGNKMRTILAALTRNRVIALMCGAFVTMVIQSSSATTVMLVSFVQAGLMSFTQS
ncbi:MAG: Na/Pi symporter, partial [Deltaproteobacteria bacterium]|nr:Na/Pi symporter [Deltaproteobacteria bacterium]